MAEFPWYQELFEEVKKKLDKVKKDKKRLISLYAFNGSWKTRISKEFESLNDNDEWVIKVLCYNALFEDLFRWNNEIYSLDFDKNNWLFQTIINEWLEERITKKFQTILNTKIEPQFNFEEWNIIFNFSSWDDEANFWIKISRWEESIFVWCIFSIILDLAIEQQNEDSENRSTNIFDNLEYIIIDDPVSSMDDTRIISIALDLIDILNSYKNNNLKFLITTHHALFYNVLNTSILKKPYEYESLVLSKRADWHYELNEQKESPFGYHLLVIEDIKKAIDENDIQKYHFNLFRWILEKTASFLWIPNRYDCLEWDRKQEFWKLLNLYSHNRLEAMEYKELWNDDKDLFEEMFNNFISHYNFN